MPAIPRRTRSYKKGLKAGLVRLRLDQDKALNHTALWRAQALGKGARSYGSGIVRETIDAWLARGR